MNQCLEATGTDGEAVLEVGRAYLMGGGGLQGVNFQFSWT